MDAVKPCDASLPMQHLHLHHSKTMLHVLAGWPAFSLLCDGSNSGSVHFQLQAITGILSHSVFSQRHLKNSIFGSLFHHLDGGWFPYTARHMLVLCDVEPETELLQMVLRDCVYRSSSSLYSDDSIASFAWSSAKGVSL